MKTHCMNIGLIDIKIDMRVRGSNAAIDVCFSQPYLRFSISRILCLLPLSTNVFSASRRFRIDYVSPPYARHHHAASNYLKGLARTLSPFDSEMLC